MNGDRFYFDTRTPWTKHQYNPNSYTQWGKIFRNFFKNIWVFLPYWLGVKTFKI